MWAGRLGATCYDGRVESGFLNLCSSWIWSLWVKGCFYWKFGFPFCWGVSEVWFSLLVTAWWTGKPLIA